MDGVHKKDGPWLHAWHDPVASIRAHSSCVRLADLNGESSHVLLVADLDKKMKVYKGTSVISEHQLLDQPVALCVFYTDNSVPRAPAIGVAAGSYVFIFRHLRPYFKFNLPPIEIDQQDMDIWAEMTAGAVDAVAHEDALTRRADEDFAAREAVHLDGLAVVAKAHDAVCEVAQEEHLACNLARRLGERLARAAGCRTWAEGQGAACKAGRW